MNFSFSRIRFMIFTVIGTIVLMELTASAQAGVRVEVGFGHGGYHRSHYSHYCGPYRSYRYYQEPPVYYYSEPRYVYVEPPVQPVAVVPSVAPAAAPEPETQATAPEMAPPPYGGRIGNTDEVQSPHSDFRLKTKSPRNTVVYDAYTGQAFRLP